MADSTTNLTTILKEQILSKRIHVVCGTGGVGKTTLSAALGILAAGLGKRTLVITMDPAKRLAQTMGLKKLAHEASDLTQLLDPQWLGCSAIPGSLHAIMPDTEKTLDQFIDEMASSPRIAQSLRKNPIYQIFAREFSGAQEYMAMEKLDQLAQNQEYECIILDTPPSRNTLAFLESPTRLSRFFEDSILGKLIHPAKNIFLFGTEQIQKIFEKLTGRGFLSLLIDFSQNLFEIRTQMLTNLTRISRTLGSPQTSFWMITAPSHESTAEILHFLKTLKEKNYHLNGLIMNRSFEIFRSEIEAPPPYDHPAWNLAVEILRNSLNAETLALQELQKHHHHLPMFMSPELETDVHSMEDLAHVATHLYFHPLVQSAPASRS